MVHKHDTVYIYTANTILAKSSIEFIVGAKFRYIDLPGVLQVIFAEWLVWRNPMRRAENDAVLNQNRSIIR